MLVVGIILGLAGGGLIFAILVLLKKQATSSVGAEVSTLASEVPALEARIVELVDSGASKASRAQLSAVENQIEAATVDLEKEKANLKQIEQKLDEAQKLVEQKETVHQEMKSSKEEDELKLKELAEKYSDLSSESMSLEQQLANSMKNLDQLMRDVKLTDDQKALFDDLSNGLSAAGERMRDLLTEYNTVNERLELLQQQHRDLEDEYTRLVEQQLGE